ncbi:hypothetical protein ACFL6E_01295 [Candidatus Neomarinimicrobiota bacterium]
MHRRFYSLSLVLLVATVAYPQGDISYPREELFGGGIGYAPTFLLLKPAEIFPFNVGDDATNTDLLGTSGLNFDDLSALGTMMVLHGAEGFGNITGNWRIGAYVGLGGNSITRVDSATEATVDLKVTLMTGNASVEYVMPLFSNLELSAGSLLGFSRGIIQFTRVESTPDWEGQFNQSDTLNSTVALSGTFFSFQPYVAIKLQFLDRAGLRMSAGYQIGSLAANDWKLNDSQRIIAPSETKLNALAIRVMLYIGI